jgi:hypothetical protein
MNMVMEQGHHIWEGSTLKETLNWNVRNILGSSRPFPKLLMQMDNHSSNNRLRMYNRNRIGIHATSLHRRFTLCQSISLFRSQQAWT